MGNNRVRNKGNQHSMREHGEIYFIQNNLGGRPLWSSVSRWETVSRVFLVRLQEDPPDPKQSRANGPT